MAASSPPSIASLATPTSPTRPSRLRGLSYLRNYTQNHLHSRDSASPSSSSGSRPFPLIRATSYPSPTSTPTTNQSNPIFGNSGQYISPASSTPATNISGNSSTGQDPSSATSGWLPTSGAASAALSGTNTSLEDNAMGRTRSGTAVREAGSDISQMNGGSDPQLQYGSTLIGAVTATNSTDKPTIRFSQHQDVRAPRPSLVFSPMGRTLPTGREIIRVGRYSERETQPNQPANLQTAAPVGFKSKVVSRRHCEFWSQDGVWYIKDVKSSSGTFLNHVRLSSPGTESKPWPVKDGDIVQLGIDFKGGEEMIFRCVKIRVELNRAWQNSLNSFNVASHKQLRNMAKQLQSPTGTSSSQDCSICLGAVAPCQSLFVAPCSHTWHYKCVRRIINGPQWPTFVCPNCRAVADLEADVDEPLDEGEWEEIEALPNQGPTTIPIEIAVDSAHPNEQDAASDEVVGNLNEVLNRLQINGSGEEFVAVRSNSSVAPIDIAIPGRTPSRSRQDTSATISDYDEQSTERNVRTPSPTGRLPASVPGQAGQDGPMTPRNDVGPFIFDGSAGRIPVSGGRIAALNGIAVSVAGGTSSLDGTPGSSVTGNT